MSIDEYLATRAFKYSERLNITPPFTSSPDLFYLPEYFGSWLSGFIEAEGSFAIRSGSLGFSFSTGQLNDLYLMRWILDYFGKNKIKVQIKKRAPGPARGGVNPFYFIEIENIKGVELVVRHLIAYPLMGHKYYQLAVVMESSKALSHLRHHFWK